MVTFEDDDEGFRTWRYANASGYVINTLRGGKSGEPVLHAAMCETIGPAPDTPWTTGEYVKVCSNDRFELEQWARSRNLPLRACTHCDP
jgi:hypothetical protein